MFINILLIKEILKNMKKKKGLFQNNNDKKEI